MRSIGDRITALYVLKDPRNGEVRYVGKTCVQPASRFKMHIWEGRTRKRTYKANWIYQLLTVGLKPQMEVVGFLPEAEVDFGERTLIRCFLRSGIRLTNLTDGGEGAPGFIQSRETRLKRSISMHGITRSPETRQKMTAAQKLRAQKETRCGEANNFHKLTTAQVIAIRKAYADGARQVDLAQQFGVGQPHISDVVLRIAWAHVEEGDQQKRDVNRGKET